MGQCQTAVYFSSSWHADCVAMLKAPPWLLLPKQLQHSLCLHLGLCAKPVQVCSRINANNNQPTRYCLRDDAQINIVGDRDWGHARFEHLQQLGFVTQHVREAQAAIVCGIFLDRSGSARLGFPLATMETHHASSQRGSDGKVCRGSA